MKNFSLLMLLCIGLFTTSCNTTQKLESKNFENKSFGLEPFHTISASEGITVTLHESFDYRADARSNFMEYLRLDVDDEGKLLIYFDEPSFSQFKKNETTVEVWAKDVHKFEASSGASLEVDGNFSSSEQIIHVQSSGDVKYDVTCEKLIIEVSSSGDYAGRVKANELFAAASSSGDIKIKGEAKTAELKASSSGDIDAANFSADIVNASVTSSGDVKIGVIQELNADVSSSGDLKYKPNGNIQMNIDKSSGGDVKELKGIF